MARGSRLNLQLHRRAASRSTMPSHHRYDCEIMAGSRTTFPPAIGGQRGSPSAVRSGRQDEASDVMHTPLPRSAAPCNVALDGFQRRASPSARAAT
jgi:hypothetical protein